MTIKNAKAEAVLKPGKPVLWAGRSIIWNEHDKTWTIISIDRLGLPVKVTNQVSYFAIAHCLELEEDISENHKQQAKLKKFNDILESSDDGRQPFSIAPKTDHRNGKI